MSVPTRITYADTIQMVRDFWIRPHRCTRCHLTGLGLSWRMGYDDGTDPQYVGYQCNSCGNVQGLTRATILRRMRKAAQ